MRKEKKSKKSFLSTFLIIIIIALISLSVYEYSQIKKYDRYKDYINDLDYNLLHLRYNENGTYLVNLTDNEKVMILMNYSHYNIAGVCFDKSNGFELLAKNEGIRAEHIALVCEHPAICSHAVSRVLLNNTWIYIDSYYNKIFTLEDFHNQGYYLVQRNMNCYNQNCTNYNELERFINYFTLTKTIAKW